MIVVFRKIIVFFRVPHHRRTRKKGTPVYIGVTSERTSETVRALVLARTPASVPYDELVAALTVQFGQRMSEVHNGTLLQHCDQRPRESVSPYIPELRKLSVDCNFVTRDPTPPLFANSIMLPSVLWCGPISRSLSSRSKISLSKLHVIWPRLHARRGRRCDRFPPGVGLSFPLCDLQRLLIARAHRESLSADEARDDWPLRRSQ